MSAAPLPLNESSRLATLEALALLETPAEPGYDALVRAAALACGTPISLISLVGEQSQWFKANLGLEGMQGSPRQFAFCAHAIAGSQILEVPDATQDSRFADNPYVTGAPDIRFYAGVPLALDNGDAVGTLCVLDRQPRQLQPAQRELLGHLAQAAVQLMEQRRRLLQADTRLQGLQARFEGAPVGLFVADRRGRLDDANERLCQLWRQPLLGLLGDDWLQHVHADDMARVRAKWSHGLMAGRPTTLRLRLRGDDPHLRLLLRAQPMADGRWVGACDVDLSPPA